MAENAPHKPNTKNVQGDDRTMKDNSPFGKGGNTGTACIKGGLPKENY